MGELEQISVRIEDEGLQHLTVADRLGVTHVDPAFAQGGDDADDVVDQERHVLPAVWRYLGLDQVHLVTVAGVEPGAAEAELGPWQQRHAEDLVVEGERPGRVGDVERDVVDVGDQHDARLVRHPREHDRTMRRSTTEPAWWERRRFGLMIQANLASVPAWAPVGEYAEWYQAHSQADLPDVLLHPSPMVETLGHHRRNWPHVESHADFLPYLTFDRYDPDEWTELAEAAGMGYVVMVAKHHDGLCWWDAPNTDRTVLTGGPRRNVLGELAVACDRAGLVFGTYYSLLDWGDTRYPGVRYVDEVVHPHMLDLVERYGSQMLWGGGHWGAGGGHWRSDELIAAARRVRPDLLVNDRWWSDGPGVREFEYQLPDRILDESWEARRGLGGSFGYNRAERPDTLLSGSGVVALLTEVVAKGGHLALSVGPDASGRIPDALANPLREAGSWVSDHADLIGRGRPWQTWGDDACRYLDLDGELHAIDTTGGGSFADLGRAAGTVTTVVAADGAAVDFDQHDDGLVLARRRRSGGGLPAVYRVLIEAPPPAPIELFPPASPDPVELAPLLADTRPGDVVRLGAGTYSGPAIVPDDVTIRGLGADRTRIRGSVVVGRAARIEHCTVEPASDRIAWLPLVSVRLAGPASGLLGCRVDGHVEVTADDARVTSCTLTGVVARDCDRLHVSRSTLRGMQWDCAVDVTDGHGHVVESCDVADVLVAVRLRRTVAAVVRGNRLRARWWGVQLVDTEATQVSGNAVERTMRAVDVDGGTLAEVTGNAVRDGDSGCVVQRGASACMVTGNRWERCRTGLVADDAVDLRHHRNDCVDLTEDDYYVS